MRTERVQVLIEPDERERFARAASRCGESLSTWLRRAGHERLEREATAQISSVSELRAFFETCESRDDGTPEPDWHEQKGAIETSKASGTAQT